MVPELIIKSYSITQSLNSHGTIAVCLNQLRCFICTRKHVSISAYFYSKCCSPLDHTTPTFSHYLLYTKSCRPFRQSPIATIQHKIVLVISNILYIVQCNKDSHPLATHWELKKYENAENVTDQITQFVLTHPAHRTLQKAGLGIAIGCCKFMNTSISFNINVKKLIMKQQSVFGT